MAFSPDGTMLVTSHTDYLLRLWTVATGKQLGTLQGHRRLVACVVFNPDGKTIASSSEDGDLKLWDVGQFNNTFVAAGAGCRTAYSCAFSPDGRSFASASQRGPIILLETASRQTRSVLMGSNGPAPLVFSPNGRILATGNGAVKLWNANTEQLIGILPGEDLPAKTAAEAINRLMFSPDGELLLARGDKGNIRIWHVPSWTKITDGLSAVRNIFASAIEFAQNEQLLVLSKNDGMILSFENPKRTLLAEARTLISLLVDQIAEKRASPASALLKLAGSHCTHCKSPSKALIRKCATPPRRLFDV